MRIPVWQSYHVAGHEQHHSFSRSTISNNEGTERYICMTISHVCLFNHTEQETYRTHRTEKINESVNKKDLDRSETWSSDRAGERERHWICYPFPGYELICVTTCSSVSFQPQLGQNGGDEIIKALWVLLRVDRWDLCPCLERKTNKVKHVRIKDWFSTNIYPFEPGASATAGLELVWL